MKFYNFIKQNNISKNLFLIYCAGFSLIIYFLFFTFFGNKGLIEYFSLKNRIDKREFIKQDLQRELQIKKDKVGGMNSESLDLDLLDEEARRALGHSNKDEIVIYQQGKSKKNGK